MNLRKYRMSLSKIECDFADRLDALGHEIRRDVVEPLCCKYGLKFFSDNGNFFFAKGEAVYDTDASLPNDEMGCELALVMELLNQQFLNADYLGFHVASVRDVEGT